MRAKAQAVSHLGCLRMQFTAQLPGTGIRRPRQRLRPGALGARVAEGLEVVVTHLLVVAGVGLGAKHVSAPELARSVARQRGR